MKFVINGDFFAKPVTGVQRYAMEITKQLDLLLKDVEFDVEILVPVDCSVPLKFKNIRIVRYGNNIRFVWQQLFLSHYCRKMKAICICLCTVPPILYSRCTVLVVHDASMLVNPQYYSKKFLFYNKVLCWSQGDKLKRIVTVSKFSKNELDKYWINGRRDINVIPNAADHILDISPDDTVLDKFKIKPHSYYYALSSLSPNKNFKWILENAKYNPNECYVVSGKKIDIYSDSSFKEIPENVLFTGYVSDGEMVSLMKNCKAFIFPTLYEGFGITPLEALMLGKKIIISDIPVMHEVYEDSAIYINPYKYDYSIEELYTLAEGKQNTIMGKYSWKKSALGLKSLISEIDAEKETRN